VFLDPQPTEVELLHFYENSYNYDQARYKNAVRKELVWLDLLEKLSGGTGNLLEVGCSYGYFLSAARERGWSVTGVDLGGEATEHARAHLGLPVLRGRIATLLDGNSLSFDAVAAWHVLEHDLQPREFLQIALRLLRPGGILALRVPNLGSTVARLAGPGWQWLSPPEHVYMYTGETLSAFLEQCGFKILEIKTARGNSRNMWFELLRARTKMATNLWSRKKLGTDVDFRFSAPKVYQDRIWYRAVEEIIGFAAIPFDWPASKWMRTTGKEAELAIIAQKPASPDAVRADFEAPVSVETT
jgi:2-polyprenyl-3-methyl-5-hydroxy-6-metoxy-1,4-benzoquinol methylase